MPLYNLELLDLSVNIISNIKFLRKMSKKCKNLQTLYLNDNKINDISSLIKYDENNRIIPIFNLKSLTLKNNNLDERDKTIRKIIFQFINDQMNIDYNDDENFIHQNTSENA